VVVAKVRERPAVNKHRSHRFNMEKFSLKKLKEVGDKEQCPLRSTLDLLLWKI
jgi:hypothetical protein